MPVDFGRCQSIGAMQASQSVKNEKVPKVAEERGGQVEPSQIVKKEKVPRVPHERDGQVAFMEERNQADHDISRS